MIYNKTIFLVYKVQFRN